MKHASMQKIMDSNTNMIKAVGDVCNTLEAIRTSSFTFGMKDFAMKINTCIESLSTSQEHHTTVIMTERLKMKDFD